MSIRTNTLDGGVDGANFTVAGSGGANGDAVTNIVIANNDTPGGGAAIKYASAAANKGPLGLLITPRASNTHIRGAFDAAGSRYVARESFRYPGPPAASTELLYLRAGSNGSTAKTAVACNPSGQLFIAGLGVTDVLSRMTNPLVAGNWYHIEAEHKKGTGASTADGVVGFRVTDNSGSELWYYHKDDVVAGTEDITQVRFGGVSTGSGWNTYALDTLRWGDLASGWIGPTADALAAVGNIVVLPTSPTSVGGSNGKIRLTWDAVPNAVSYEARIAPGADATTGWITKTGSDANRAGTDFTNLAPGVYTYQVRAKAS